jgi:hypothetical protein
MQAGIQDIPEIFYIFWDMYVFIVLDISDYTVCPSNATYQ